MCLQTRALLSRLPDQDLAKLCKRWVVPREAPADRCGSWGISIDLQASKSPLLDDILVATEDKRIFDYCLSESIPVIMTSDQCLTGTDRLAEVAKTIQTHKQH